MKIRLLSANSDEKTARLIFRYMLPVGQKEFPVEVEIRFPHELADSVVTEIKRVLWPLMPVVERVNFPKEPEMEIEVEDSEIEDEVEIKKAKPSRRKKSS